MFVQQNINNFHNEDLVQKKSSNVFVYIYLECFVYLNQCHCECKMYQVYQGSHGQCTRVQYSSQYFKSEISNEIEVGATHPHSFNGGVIPGHISVL